MTINYNDKLYILALARWLIKEDCVIAWLNKYRRKRTPF